MGAHFSLKSSNFTTTNDGPSLQVLSTRTLKQQSSNKQINSIQKLVLGQYPYLEEVKESVLITDCSLPDNPIIFANDCFEKMTLYPKEEIVGRNCRFLQGKHTNPETVSKIRDAVTHAVPLEVEILNYRKDGVAFWNHFLMLPVFKNKKQRYIIAVQKNITTIKQGNHPNQWTPAELAMWLEHYGIRGKSQKMIKSGMDGSSFLGLDTKTILQNGFLLRSDQDELLEASLYLRENVESPFEKNQTAKPAYHPALSGFVNYSVDACNPSELAYWEREGAKEDTVLFKSYYQDQISVFLWSRENSSFQAIATEIASSFSLKHVRLSSVNFENQSTTPIYTASEFMDYMEREHAAGCTVHFFVEEDEKNLLSLTSLLYSVPDPILIVNHMLHVLYSNKAANKLLGVQNATELPNGSQLLPELPVRFPSYPHLRTTLMVRGDEVSVDCSITSHSESAFLFIIRPVGYLGSSKCTVGYRDTIENTENQKHLRADPESEQDVENENEEAELLGRHPNAFPASRLDSSQGFSGSLVSFNGLTQTHSLTSKDLIVVKPIALEEGCSSVLSKTLDKILFADDTVMAEMFASSFKLFHTEESVKSELLSLVDHYCSQSEELNTFMKEEGSLLERLVTNMASLLELWMKQFPEDFQDILFRDGLTDMIDRLPPSDILFDVKKKLVRNRRGLRNEILAARFTVDVLAHADSGDIADALTMYTTVIFKRIKIQEFYQTAWLKVEKEECSPHLLLLHQRADQLQRWVIKSILVPGKKTRAKKIQKVIVVAQKLLARNNFENMAAVIFALNSIHCTRLKKTWALVSQKYMVWLDTMKMLLDSQNNFAAYRGAFENVVDSDHMGIPYMRVVLRDLMYTYQYMTKDCSTENLGIIGPQMAAILRMQARSFADDFISKDSLLQYFQTLTVTEDDDALYALSLRLAPSA